MPRPEHHFSGRGGWLRAAVLGANDGIVSTASLVTGIATASTDPATILLGGLAGLVAGALSMGVGEYVSVSAERDSQRADISIELEALASRPEEERQELAEAFEARGLDRELAAKVAEQLTHADALGAHLREEVNLDPEELSSPWQAAFVSMGSFTAGALPSVAVAALAPTELVVPLVMASATVALAAVGVISATQAGAPVGRGLGRVVVGGLFAMALSALAGRLAGMAL
ncbi:MAG: VIT family protein [Myxococcota bacterium]